MKELYGILIERLSPTGNLLLDLSAVWALDRFVAYPIAFRFVGAFLGPRPGFCGFIIHWTSRLAILGAAVCILRGLLWIGRELLLSPLWFWLGLGAAGVVGLAAIVRARL